MRRGARRPGLRALGVIALLAAPLAARAQTDVLASGGALAIAADPPRLVLGRDPGAELRIAAPAEVTELTVTASAGRVDSVRRLPAGGFTARYHAPAERHPQVAILAAVGRGGAAPLDGWLALPLSGQGDARLRGTPGAEVSLRIGDETFGPARVPADGVAILPVVVPPGVKEGHQGFTAVDLRVPETSLVHGVLERPSVQADRAEAVRFFAYVIAPHGAARPGEAPRIEATRGTAALREREPGAFEGTWTVPPGPAGEERLTLRLEGFPASRVTLRLMAVAGPPASVVVAFDRPALVAGKGEQVAITAHAVDASGNPSAGAVVLSADAGKLTQEEAGPGAVKAVLELEPRFEGRTKVVVRGRIPSSGAAGEAVLALQPGPAEAVSFSPRVVWARGDGSSDAVLSLSLKDAFGNPAAGPPRVTASAGPAPRLALIEPGRWEVRLRGGPVEDPTRTRLEAEAGGARGAADLWLVPPRARQLAVFAGAGVLGGRSRLGGALLVGTELPAPELLPQPPERALALRLELSATARDRVFAGGTRTASTVALLGGPVLRGLFSRGRWAGSATVGLLAGTGGAPGGGSRTGLAPALRLGVGVSAPGRTAPWLELGLLAAGSTPAGAFTALTLTLGARHDWTRSPTDAE
jgi:hypothetical protein